jgi:Peptidase propeptide and YPEB domain
MNRFITRKVAVIAALVVGIGAIGGGTALAATDTPIIGSAPGQAKAAALAHTGQGKVTETEVGDEESYYEVEVTLDNGNQVDVQLDESFNVVGSEGDRDGSSED